MKQAGLAFQFIRAPVARRWRPVLGFSRLAALPALAALAVPNSRGFSVGAGLTSIDAALAVAVTMVWAL